MSSLDKDFQDFTNVTSNINLTGGYGLGYTAPVVSGERIYVLSAIGRQAIYSTEIESNQQFLSSYLQDKIVLSQIPYLCAQVDYNSSLMPKLTAISQTNTNDINYLSAAYDSTAVLVSGVHSMVRDLTSYNLRARSELNYITGGVNHVGERVFNFLNDAYVDVKFRVGLYTAVSADAGATLTFINSTGVLQIPPGLPERMVLQVAAGTEERAVIINPLEGVTYVSKSNIHGAVREYYAPPITLLHVGNDVWYAFGALDIKQPDYEIGGLSLEVGVQETPQIQSSGMAAEIVVEQIANENNLTVQQYTLGNLKNVPFDNTKSMFADNHTAELIIQQDTPLVVQEIDGVVTEYAVTMKPLSTGKTFDGVTVEYVLTQSIGTSQLDSIACEICTVDTVSTTW